VGPSIINSNDFFDYNYGWINHKNLWIRRTAILCQLKFKSKTYEQLLYDLILQCSDEKDFFIRKSIGWALREYSMSNPNSVRLFLEKNHKFLSNLSVREGSKKLPNFALN